MAGWIDRESQYESVYDANTIICIIFEKIYNVSLAVRPEANMWIQKPYFSETTVMIYYEDLKLFGLFYRSEYVSDGVLFRFVHVQLIIVGKFGPFCSPSLISRK